MYNYIIGDVINLVSSSTTFSHVPWFLQETFERAKSWVKELQRQASPNITIALAGNKADLARDRMVDYEVRQRDTSYWVCS